MIVRCLIMLNYKKTVDLLRRAETIPSLHTLEYAPLASRTWTMEMEMSLVRSPCSRLQVWKSSV